MAAILKPAPRYVDCRTTAYDLALPPYKPSKEHSQKSLSSKVLLPILFSPWDKPELSDRLLVCFGALALSQVTRVSADTGVLLYGDGHRHRTVKTGEYVADAPNFRTRSKRSAAVRNRRRSC